MPWAFLFKGFKLSWYEWLFIGALIFLCISYYNTSNRLKETSEKLTLAQQQASIEKENTRVLGGVRDLEDHLMVSLNEDLTRLKQKHDERVFDFESAYSSEIKRHEQDTPTPDVVEPPAPETVTTVKPKSSKPHVSSPPKQTKPVIDTNRVRVGLIAKRLLNSYCTAGGVSPSCATVVPAS